MGQSAGRPHQRSGPSRSPSDPGLDGWRYLRRWHLRATANLRYAGADRPLQLPDRDASRAGRSLSCLGVRLLTFPVALLAGTADLGDPVDRVGPGQAEFSWTRLAGR